MTKEPWIRGSLYPRAGRPYMPALRYLAWPTWTVIKASLAESRGNTALYCTDPQLQEALRVSLEEAGPGWRQQGGEGDWGKV